jgi:hypothetical protein
MAVYLEDNSQKIGGPDKTVTMFLHIVAGIDWSA